MSNLALLIGGGMSCFAAGWALGRWIKTIRQFMDQL